MRFRRRTLLHWLAATTAASLTSRFAQAQSFPTRPITIVVPFPAGGPTDTLGRVLADRMKNSLGQSVIIENLTGAAGTIGSTHVARAPSDGYTLILGHWQTHVVNGATYTLPFDVVNDFAPIALIADCPVWLVGRSSLAAQNLQELIAWMKESPGKPTVGIGGAGGGADHAGSVGRPYRPDVHTGSKRARATALGPGESLRRDGQGAMGRGARYTDRR